MGFSLLGPERTGDIPAQAALEVRPGVFVALAFLFVLGYLYLLDPADIASDDKRQLRLLLLAVAVPLSVTFGAVVLITVFGRSPISVP